MRILVTGGAGFIGSHLCEKLLAQGHAVICVDNFITGNSKNLRACTENPRFKLLEHDINSPLPAAVIGSTNMAPGYGSEDAMKLDQIYHLACPGSPVDFAEIPLQVLLTCANGTKNMIELAARHGAAFLLVSSSAIYDQPEPTNPQNCFADGKRFAETLAVNYFHHYGFPLKIVRVFEVYGPRMRKHDGRAISQFIRAALMNEQMNEPARAEENKMLNFCYIDEVVDGLIKAMNSAETFDKLGAVDLKGEGDEISLRSMAEKIMAALEPGFEAKSALEQGLKHTINYFKNG